MKKVLLVTNNHLISNPRLVKEAIALSESGYQVNVFFCQSIFKLVEMDNLIISNHPDITFSSIKVYNLGLISKIYYRLALYFNRLAYSITGWNVFLNKTLSYLSSKIYHQIKNINSDLVIGHNLITLPSIVRYSKKHSIPFGFDVEDAYSLQETLDINKPDKLLYNVEAKNLYKARYISFASSCFLDYYRKEYYLNNNLVTLLNTFPNESNKSVIIKDRIDLNKISLYWYSQTVGLDRGLSDIIRALNEVNPENFELHIRGECDSETKITLLSFANSDIVKNNIYFHELVDTDELKQRAIEHDIGLALEQRISINKEWCLSNKIFEYLSAGLIIIATKTKAQNSLLSKHSDVSYLYEIGDIDSLISILNKIHLHKQDLVDTKNKVKSLSKDYYNWDLTKLEFIDTINNILQK